MLYLFTYTHRYTGLFRAVPPLRLVYRVQQRPDLPPHLEVAVEGRQAVRLDVLQTRAVGRGGDVLIFIGSEVFCLYKQSQRLGGLEQVAAHEAAVVHVQPARRQHEDPTGARDLHDAPLADIVDVRQ